MMWKTYDMFIVIINMDNARNIIESAVLTARKLDTDRFIRLHTIINIKTLPSTMSQIVVVIEIALVN
jgi:hypothetical protein